MSDTTANANRYVIIGGAPKAGTTSLFNYLAAHPKVTASRMKETRFFLDPDYPLPDYAKRTATDYEQYFAGQKTGLRIESTPLYMYSPGTPERVLQNLGGDVDWIFVLRNPVDRFISWYHYTREIGWLDSAIGLNEFAYSQLSGQQTADQNLAYSGLLHGEYARFLTPYIDLFGINRIKIVWFDDLKAEPESVVPSIGVALGLEQTFYDNFGWSIHNAAKVARFPALNRIYRSSARRLRTKLISSPTLHRQLRNTSHAMAPMFNKLLFSPAVRAEISSDLLNDLYAYYLNPNETLKDLLGEPLPSRWLAN